MHCIQGRKIHFKCESNPVDFRDLLQASLKQVVDQMHSDYVNHMKSRIVQSAPMKIDELMPLIDKTKTQILSEIDKRIRTISASDCSAFEIFVKKRIDWFETTLQGLLSSVFINFNVYGNEELEIVMGNRSGNAAAQPASKPSRSKMIAKLSELFAWSYHHFGKKVPLGSVLQRKVAFMLKLNKISFETSQQLHVEAAELFGQHLSQLSEVIEIVRRSVQCW